MQCRIVSMASKGEEVSGPMIVLKQEWHRDLYTMAFINQNGLCSLFPWLPHTTAEVNAFDLYGTVTVSQSNITMITRLQKKNRNYYIQN